MSAPPVPAKNKPPIRQSFWLVAMGLSLAAILFAGVTLAELLGRDSPLSIALGCLGITAFLFLLRIQKVDESSSLISEKAMRTSIAGAVIIEYLALVAIVAFFREAPDKIHPLTQTLINNFTTIVGIVIAFYFGSSAFIQAKEGAAASPKTDADKSRHSSL